MELAKLPIAEPNVELINGLKRALEAAESGKLCTLAYAGQYVDGDIETAVFPDNGDLKTFTFIGAVEWLKVRIINRKIQEEPNGILD